jgi:hypothetical protein
MLLLALCAALALCQAVSFQLPFNVRNIFKMKMSDGTQELTGGIGVMKDSIDKQFKLGKSITYGVLQTDVDTSNVPSKKEQAAMRKQAAAELVNIDTAERDRRKNAAKVGAVVSTVLYGGLIYAKVSFLPMAAALYLPVAFSYGFYKSGEQGL